jgi:hypothetical protein
LSKIKMSRVVESSRVKFIFELSESRVLLPALSAHETAT